MNQKTAPLTLCELADPGVPGLESFSPFCLKVHRALRSAGLSYTRKHGAYPAVFKQYNKTGQVPVLLVGDEAVADSTAILRRIDVLAPGSMSGPGDARTRAEVWLWEDFADTSINGFLVASRWVDERNWPGVKQAYFSRMPSILRAIVPGRMRARITASLVARDVWRAGPEACWARFDTLLDELDARAPREGFWMGDTPTAADFSIFGQLHGLRHELTAYQRDSIAQRKALSAYLDRVNARTAAAAA